MAYVCMFYIYTVIKSKSIGNVFATFIYFDDYDTASRSYVLHTWVHAP